MATDKISGSEALIRSLLEENVKLIYGYPGGAIMPVFDCMHNYKDRLKHVLVRHEQGATHAAQGFARVSGETGVVLVTSGPAATNIITGVADAMVDSTRCRRNYSTGYQMELSNTPYRRYSLGRSKSFLYCPFGTSRACSTGLHQRCASRNS